MVRRAKLLLILLAAACSSAPASNELGSRQLFVWLEEGPEAHTAKWFDDAGQVVADVAGLDHVYSARPTPSGTVLATLCTEDGRPLGLAEVATDGRILWHLQWPGDRAGIAFLRASHALANGNVIVVGVDERGDDGRHAGAVILEMDRSGNELRSVELGPTQYVGAIRPLDHGMLVAGEGVFNLDWNGERRMIVPPSDDTLCFDVLPLPDGALLVAETSQRIVRLERDGTESWSAWHYKPVFLQLLGEDRFLAGG